MNFNFSQLRRCLCGAVNQQVTQATGMNVMGKYNEARWQAGRVGLNIESPEQALDHVFDKRQQQTARAKQLKATATERLVSTIQEFIALRDRAAKSPLGGAVCLAHALLNWANPATRALGAQMLVLAVAEDQLQAGSTYKNYALGDEMAGNLEGVLQGGDFMPALCSLVAGTDPKLGYQFNPMSVALVEDLGAEEGQDPPQQSGKFTVYFCSSGDTNGARGVEMTVNKNGIWKAREFRSLFNQVQPPPVTTTAADDL